MRTLVIDTATAACSVALWDEGDRLLTHRTEVVSRGHAERLLPMIADLPDGGRAPRILVDVGPGSFTGIRVGIAAARGLALGWGSTVAGYSSLSLIAGAAMATLDRAHPFAVVIEGGHGEVFMQSFTGHPCLTSLDEMVSLAPAAALLRLGDRMALGSGVGRLSDLPAAQNAGRGWLADTSHALRLPAALRQLPPKPLYGRAPDAKIPAPH